MVTVIVTKFRKFQMATPTFFFFYWNGMSIMKNKNIVEAVFVAQKMSAYDISKEVHVE